MSYGNDCELTWTDLVVAVLRLFGCAVQRIPVQLQEKTANRQNLDIHDMTPLLAWVIACKKTFIVYRFWNGNAIIKGFELHKARRDFEIALAVWKVNESRKVNK